MTDDNKDLQELFAQAKKEVEEEYTNFEKQSAVHRAALQIMQFEKGLFTGDVTEAHHLEKIRNIITNHLESITNEIN